MTTILVPPGEGERVHWPAQGHDFCLKVSPPGGGSFSLTEAVIPPGKGAGLHIHEESEECWYVLDGEYRFTVGSDEFTAGPARPSWFLAGHRMASWSESMAGVT